MDAGGLAPGKDIVPFSYGFRGSPAISMILEWNDFGCAGFILWNLPS